MFRRWNIRIASELVWCGIQRVAFEWGEPTQQACRETSPMPRRTSYASRRTCTPRPTDAVYSVLSSTEVTSLAPGIDWFPINRSDFGLEPMMSEPRASSLTM